MTVAPIAELVGILLGLAWGSGFLMGLGSGLLLAWRRDR